MRGLLLLVLASCGESPSVATDAGAPDVVAEAQPQVVRIMAANITSGTQQSYEDPGIRIFQGLAPDVVLIQELNYAGGRDALVATAFGQQFSYFVEPSGQIPNGIVSRYAIESSGSWVDASTSDRGFAWALIDIPGPTDLFVVSLHLLTTGATERDTEAKQVVSYVQANVPAGAYLVIGGDFNTDVTTEPALADLAALVEVAPPFPMDQLGNTNTSINRNHPHDWLLADTTLESHAVATWQGSSVYASGLVFDSRVYTPLAEVAPVLATDSAATGMQHMPVVRDFSF